jgi:hypothetical protein
MVITGHTILQDAADRVVTYFLDHSVEESSSYLEQVIAPSLL